VTPACLGLRVHSGWAALVAVAGEPRSPGVVLRERIEMADPEARQPYHAAEGLRLLEAERLLKRFRRAAEARAERAIARAVRELRERGHEPKAACILQAAGRLPKDLASILASHALIHTADGVHFRGALRRACESAGLDVLDIPERELLGNAAADLKTPPDELQRQVAAWGRPLGPPWTADQKLAALAAWTMLANNPRAGPRDRREARAGLRR
jgi:hypothetical protein